MGPTTRSFAFVVKALVVLNSSIVVAELGELMQQERRATLGKRYGSTSNTAGHSNVRKTSAKIA